MDAMAMAPTVAVVNPNTLAALGLTNILQGAMPMMRTDVFGSFAELEANDPDMYFHYFVDLNIVMGNQDFFLKRHKKTIVLSQSTEHFILSGRFHNICVSLPKRQLLRSILMLENEAHAGGRNLPPMGKPKEAVLSGREIEVLTLIVNGHINKEIADKLKISVSTVITHRKNIMAKLSVKSVSSLTAYAVTHGYVDINSI